LADSQLILNENNAKRFLGGIFLTHTVCISSDACTVLFSKYWA